MIFLVIFGGLMLLLGAFYLANSWMEYRTWKSGTIIVVLSLIATVYGAINLPYWHHRSAQQEAQTSQPAPAKNSSSAAFANSASSVLNSPSQQGAQQSDKEMAVLRQLQKGYSKLGGVEFREKDKAYVVTPTDDQTKQAVEALHNDPSIAQQIGWPNLTKSLKSTSKQLKTALGPGYQLQLVDPSSGDVLYSAKDGQTVQDIAQR